jgi:hypothetical protein
MAHEFLEPPVEMIAKAMVIHLENEQFFHLAVTSVSISHRAVTEKLSKKNHILRNITSQ